jgi:hypothetical protein
VRRRDHNRADPHPWGCRDVEIRRGRERREVQVFALLDALILVGGGGGKGGGKGGRSANGAEDVGCRVDR